MIRKISAFLVLLFTLTVYPQVADHKVTPMLKYELSQKPVTEKMLVWIEFTDKGNALSKYNVYESVSERAVKRRGKVLSKESRFDFTDYPVNEEYIRQIESLGTEIRHKSKWLNSVSAFIDVRTLVNISKLGCVKQVDVVARLKKPAEVIESDKPIDVVLPKSSLYSLNYGNSLAQNEQINVPAVHDLGFTGQNVVVCVLDAGFNRLSHESFATMNIIAKWDFVNNDPGVGDSTDMGSGTHGTQTLSTIGGYKSGSLIGPAFGADYILAKTENTDSETPIEEDNWIRAMEWADSIGVDVTSTSLGYLDFDPPYTSYTWQSMDGNTCRITIAADLAVKKGIVVVNSAGNEGFHSTQNTLGAPADGDSVIAVGAVTSTGTRSSFSSVGNTVDGRVKPDVMARGSSVRVASTSSNTQYSSSSGTSFSCPLAAGVAALVLSARPNLTPMQVREAMRNTASNAAAPNREFGWGILNALAAVNYFAVPVEGWTFIAGQEGGDITLKWQTVSENNNKGFEIQRSPDKSNWKSLAFVDGNGTTLLPHSYQYTDKSAPVGRNYYRLKQIDFSGGISYSEVLEARKILPGEFTLYQNYPNPFNPQTTISFHLPSRQFILIKISDILGNTVANIAEGMYEAGEHSLSFSPDGLPSGVYFYTLSSGERSRSRKMLITR
ncbi:MAG: S8 family serine peptidase [Ignavibacteriaceae bacterium]|nr:S8 family serine peptidase [Ignavibacteriaceae bacterium]